MQTKPQELHAQIQKHIFLSKDFLVPSEELKASLVLIQGNKNLEEAIAVLQSVYQALQEIDTR